MSEIFKLQYNNNTLTYPGWNGYVCYDKPSGYPITYLSDDHVSVTGDDLYIPGSEGLQLQSSYDPYYRIDYEITNGEIVDGLLIPTGPCTVYAKDKINYFTATGNFNYTNSYATGNKSNTYSGICKSVTGSIPSTYLGQSSAWKPTNNVSAYYITATPSVKVQIASYNANFTGRLLINDTQQVQKTARLVSQVGSYTPSTTFNLSKDSTTTGSIKIYLTAYCDSPYRNFGWNQISNNGWTATGIAP